MPSLVRLRGQAQQLAVLELCLTPNMSGRCSVPPCQFAHYPYTWTLEVAPNGYDSTDIGYLSVILNFDKNPGSFRTICEVYNNTAPDYAVIIQYGTRNDYHHAVFNHVIIFRVSHEELRNSGSIHDGMFIIRCNVYFEIHCAQIPVPVLPVFDDTTQVALIVGDKTIEISRNLLIHVSPSFSAMLTNYPNDGDKIRVNVGEAFTSTSVLCLKNFLYGNFTELPNYDISELLVMLKLVDLYEVTYLQTIFTTTLCEHLIVDDDFGSVIEYAWATKNRLLKFHCSRVVSNLTIDEQLDFHRNLNADRSIKSKCWLLSTLFLFYSNDVIFNNIVNLKKGFWEIYGVVPRN